MTHYLRACAKQTVFRRRTPFDDKPANYITLLITVGFLGRESPELI